MGGSLKQFLEMVNALPASKKLSIVFIVMLIAAGFAAMFFLANREDYQTLFSNLSSKDGGAVIAELQKQKVPYKVGANGTSILVPAERVYELRLSLAAGNLPRGGNIGFEIFDKTDFRTTKFVQELNYQRALQGELSRTINQFNEVTASKVFIVTSKESLFIDDKKPASASIQLDLRSNLPANKLAAIVHLVANAVEDLDPENVTVVDTKGRLIFKGGSNGSASFLLSGSQLDYKKKVESEIRENVQTMLEGIVGAGKAIVRVTAEIDFNKITMSEEEYDPAAKVVRSERNIEESSREDSGRDPVQQGNIGQRTGVVPASSAAQNGKIKKDIATNYEINKVTRNILKPAGSITRLSVAAVIDGTYDVQALADGSIQKTYVQRNEEELRKFEEIVKKAMGYNEDREDQVTVDSISFAGAMPAQVETEMVGSNFDILETVATYRKTLVNFFLIAIMFFFVVRPLLKSMKTMTVQTMAAQKKLAAVAAEPVQISGEKEVDLKEKVFEISQNNPERTRQLIKGWIGEQE